jgi:hypothetical protein
MSLKVVNIIKELPLEVDKTYITKFSTKESFTIKRIDTNSNGRPITVWGIYEKSPHLGICPLNPERLFPDKEGNKQI